MCSSVRAPRSAGSMPRARNSSFIQPRSDAEHEAPVAEHVERGRLGREVHRVAVGQHQHAGAEPHAIGHRRRTWRASRAGRATACPATSPPRCRSAGTGTGSCARTAASRGARPRRSRSRGGPPPPRPAAPSPCRGRGRRSVARRRCARGNPNRRRSGRTPSCTSDCCWSCRPSARTSTIARRAEEAGFDSAWAPEFHNHSGPLALAAAALETERIELGTAIAWAFGRSPLLTAVTALDLDEMSGGRFVLGLGTGTRRMRTDWLGAPAERARDAACARRSRRCARCGTRRARAPSQYEGELVKLNVRPYGRAGPGPPAHPGLRRRGQRGDDADGGSDRRRRRGAPDGDRALHRGGDAPGDRGGRGRGGPRAFRRVRRRLGAAGGVRGPRAGARGRQAPDRVPRNRAHVRPDPRPARVHRRRGAHQGAVEELRPGRA